MFLKIIDSRNTPGNKKEMLYKNEDGKWYLGPANILIGDKIIAEVSKKPDKNGNYRIIRYDIIHKKNE